MHTVSIQYLYGIYLSIYLLSVCQSASVFLFVSASTPPSAYCGSVSVCQILCLRLNMRVYEEVTQCFMHSAAAVTWNTVFRYGRLLKFLTEVVLKSTIVKVRTEPTDLPTYYT